MNANGIGTITLCASDGVYELGDGTAIHNGLRFDVARKEALDNRDVYVLKRAIGVCRKHGTPTIWQSNQNVVAVCRACRDSFVQAVRASNADVVRKN